MTIRDAYKKNEGKDIWIYYVWEMRCLHCEKHYFEEDEEYSVFGTLEDFEEFRKDYDCLELDYEVEECVDENGEVFYKYIADETHTNNGELCPICNAEEDF